MRCRCSRLWKVSSSHPSPLNFKDLCILHILVLRCLWQNPDLSAQMQSILARVLIALHLALPRFPRVLLSANPSFHAQFSKNVQDIIIDIGSGTSNVSGRSLKLIVAFLDSDRVRRRSLLSEFLLYIVTGNAATYRSPDTPTRSTFNPTRTSCAIFSILQWGIFRGE